MISDLLDMFNKTSFPKEETIKNFKTIIKICTTQFGSDLYGYMLMLEQQGRKTEMELIKGYRDRIFGIRDTFDRNMCGIDLLVSELTSFNEQLRVHMTIIRTVEDRKWEELVFRNTINEVANFIFYMKNAEYPDPTKKPVPGGI